EPNLEECFYAWKDSPAFLNDKEIKVSSVDKLANALLATGFPYTNFDRMKPYMEVFDFCMRETHGLRRLGSAAVDLAYVAAGRFEGFYEYGLNSWDVAAGAFIIQQAGGKISDFSGGENFVFGKEIIATNRNVFGEFLEVVKQRFNS
ncbi:MAG: inositol monophosphatase family protein, partial [Bacteroidota bacterium]